ncbi:uncharacterized protein BDZ99DRAFT_514301 [Mytilinidion resinicola]|uniref:DUF7580 domain-containing protein n=1 Tax=Mytilinidion resinicola TaxID=574789 RepID=A0A6A6Z397_9PEZI|nr:uncharacterized protein BDZ99DRAFT_514301 [Mytilinidion resinicola]KAF2815642.1 hypothetical protein BDZ99DRAFT_514301 [Mytilinidion resinicola]
MSGAEVGGLVLGGISLAIAAVEHYHNLSQTVHGLKNYHCTIQQLRLDLIIQQDQLKQSLKQLGFDDFSIPSTHHALRNRIYCSRPDLEHPEMVAGVIWSIEETIEGLRKKLKRCDDTQRRSKPTKAWNRFRHTFTAKFRKGPWKNSNILITFIQEAQSQYSSSKCDTIRVHAFEVFNYFKLGWKCSCVGPHQTGIRFDTVSSTLRVPISEVAIRTFKSLQGQDALLQHENKTQCWIETLAKLETVPAVDSGPDPDPKPLPPSASSAPASQNGFNSKSPATDVECLCEALSRHDFQEGSLPGVKADNRRRMVIKVSNTEAEPHQTQYNTLESFVGLSGRFDLISRVQRLGIAYAMAIMLLHLGETPWLDSKWGKGHVSLARRKQETTPDITLEDVRVLHEFQSPASSVVSPRRPNQQAGRINSLGNHSPAMLSQGILLVELCLNEDQSALLAAAFSGSFSPDTRDRQICKIIERVYLEGGNFYGSATERCLQCQFTRPAATKIFMDSNFRENFFKDVIALLQVTYEVSRDTYRNSSKCVNLRTLEKGLPFRVNDSTQNPF